MKRTPSDQQLPVNYSLKRDADESLDLKDYDLANIAPEDLAMIQDATTPQHVVAFLKEAYNYASSRVPAANVPNNADDESSREPPVVVHESYSLNSISWIQRFLDDSQDCMPFLRHNIDEIERISLEIKQKHDDLFAQQRFEEASIIYHMYKIIARILSLSKVDRYTFNDLHKDEIIKRIIASFKTFSNSELRLYDIYNHQFVLARKCSYSINLRAYIFKDGCQIPAKIVLNWANRYVHMLRECGEEYRYNIKELPFAEFVREYLFDQSYELPYTRFQALMFLLAISDSKTIEAYLCMHWHGYKCKLIANIQQVML